MPSSNIITALLLTLAAGLSTTLGSLLVLTVKKPNPRFMGFTLGFSAGVMILVSFVELLQYGIDTIGFFEAHAAFFIGMLVYFGIDQVVPHEYLGQRDFPQHSEEGRLVRTGTLVALGIAIHNFPEGMATFAGALEDVRVGLAIAIAIAIHNIPEGLAVAVPIYAATGSRNRAFLWSFFSGVSEPLGAGFAALILFPFLTPALLGWLLASVAGIMVAISVDELVPAAKSYEGEHVPILGVILGMVVMAVSLWFIT